MRNRKSQFENLASDLENCGCYLPVIFYVTYKICSIMEAVRGSGQYDRYTENSQHNQASPRFVKTTSA